MTSISQPVLPPQASNNASQSVAQPQSSSASLSGRTPPQAAGTAPPPVRSYANATKKQSPPASATNSSAGGAVPPQHGKSDSLNGKGTIPPAVPAVGGTSTTVNGNTSTNSSSGPIDHGRKASITITPAGTSGYLPNGGQVGGKPTGGKDIQFGTFNKDGSPALANAVPQLSQSANNLAVNPQNPRVTSPAASPSPIPQPPASGGRPPSTFQGQTNGMSFGSMLAGDDANVSFLPSSQLNLLTHRSDSCDQACLSQIWDLGHSLRTSVENPLNPLTVNSVWSLAQTAVDILRKLGVVGERTADSIPSSSRWDMVRGRISELRVSPAVLKMSLHHFNHDNRLSHHTQTHPIKRTAVPP